MKKLAVLGMGAATFGMLLLSVSTPALAQRRGGRGQGLRSQARVCPYGYPRAGVGGGAGPGAGLGAGQARSYRNTGRPARSTRSSARRSTAPGQGPGRGLGRNAGLNPYCPYR